MGDTHGEKRAEMLIHIREPFALLNTLSAGTYFSLFRSWFRTFTVLPKDVKGVVQGVLHVHRETVPITRANYKRFNKQTTILTNVT